MQIRKREKDERGGVRRGERSRRTDRFGLPCRTSVRERQPGGFGLQGRLSTDEDDIVCITCISLLSVQPSWVSGEQLQQLSSSPPSTAASDKQATKTAREWDRQGAKTVD